MNTVLIKQLHLMPGVTTFRSQATAVQLCVGKIDLKIPYPVNGYVEGLFVSFGFFFTDSKDKVRPRTVPGEYGYIHFPNPKGTNLLLPVITKKKIK